MTNYWESFKHNIKEKINPFFGTIIIVWITHNWRAVYSFFFFDKEYSLTERIQYFEKYWSDKNFILNLVIVIAISFLVLIATLILLNLSKLITNFFVDIITPLVYRATKRSNVIEISKYNQVIERNHELEKAIIEERELRIKMQREKEELERNFNSGRAQLLTDGRNEALSVIKLSKKIGESKFKEFFRNFSNTTIYQTNSFIENLILENVIVTTEKSVAGYKLMMTEWGEKIRTILRVYGGD